MVDGNTRLPLIYSILMVERETRKEIVGRGELFFLCHPRTEDTFSGYGLTMESGRKGLLVGLLMIDRPNPADPEWLRQVENVFGELRLISMTATGERGIACRMQIESDSQVHLRQLSMEQAAAIKAALEPLIEQPPNPIFTLQWDEEQQLWISQIASVESNVSGYDPQRAGRYRPRISPEHLRRLWLEGQRTGKPMTRLVAEALDEYFARRGDQQGQSEVDIDIVCS